MTQKITQCEDGSIKVRTAAWSPPGCHCQGCGVIFTVKDGKVIKVEGDPDHPVTQGRLCVRCLAQIEFLYSEDRIVTPMYRDPKYRGLDMWEPISWDEATKLICDEVAYVKENWGPEALSVWQGTGREVTMYAAALAYGALGTPNHASTLAAESCYGPRFCVANFIMGSGYPELDYAAYFPERYDHPDYKVPEMIVVWGKNPLISNPDGFFGHSLIDLMKRGSKFITIDPRLTWLGARAEYHLQIRPGTDAALGLSLINVIIEEDLYDHEFVQKWCFGFKDLTARAAEYPPEKAAEICWVEADDIRGAARAIAAARPASFLWGQALDGQLCGVQACHAMLDLAAICGDLDVPGGLTVSTKDALNTEWGYEGMKQITPELWEIQTINPDHVGYRQRHHAHPDSMLDCMETGEPYDYKFAWHIGTNPLSNTAAQPKRWNEQFKKMRMNVYQDVVMTPSCMSFGDVFLPVAAFAEQNSVVSTHYGLNTAFMGSINEAVDPGQCKSDFEIALHFGKILNPEAWPWESEKDFYNDQLTSEVGITFDELSEQGIKQFPYTYRKYEKGLLRPDGRPGFNTPTGKVELKSTLYPDWNEDALPYFEEPYISPYGLPKEWAEKYPVVLTTGGRNYMYFHSEGRQIPSLRQLHPDPLVTINPQMAAEHGISEGDWVAIENMFGQCIQRARVSNEVGYGTVHAEHGWWFPEEKAEAPYLYGTFRSNINNLMPHHIVGRMGWGAPYRVNVCRIRKVNGPEDYDPQWPYEDFIQDPARSHDQYTLKRQAAARAAIEAVQE